MYKPMRIGPGVVLFVFSVLMDNGKVAGQNDCQTGIEIIIRDGGDGVLIWIRPEDQTKLGFEVDESGA